MNLDFEISSASELIPSYRDLCTENYPGKILHFYPSIEEQVSESTVCSLCTNTLAAQMLGPCKPWQGKSPDLLLSGSPCDPFSCQRAKRFSDGTEKSSVEAHAQFDVTMDQVVSLYHKWEPIIGVFEQVAGFTMPFVAGGTECPKDRLGSAWLFLSITFVHAFIGPSCFLDTTAAKDISS